MPAKVLIVEDESTHLKLIEVWLRKKGGYDVVTAKTLFDAQTKTVDLTGEKREELAQVRAAVISLTVGKDKMAGLHFAWTLRGCPHTSHIAIIITTATDEEESLNRLAESGFPFVIKPFEPAALVDLVKQAVADSDMPQGGD